MYSFITPAPLRPPQCVQVASNTDGVASLHQCAILPSHLYHGSPDIGDHLYLKTLPIFMHCHLTCSPDTNPNPNPNPYCHLTCSPDTPPVFIRAMRCDRNGNSTSRHVVLDTRSLVTSSPFTSDTPSSVSGSRASWRNARLLGSLSNSTWRGKEIGLERVSVYSSTVCGTSLVLVMLIMLR